MKKTIFILLTITILSLFFGCTSREINFTEENMGFIDNRIGTVPDTGTYLAPVKFAGYWGFIDQNGNFIIEPQFTNARPFSDGLALVNNEKGWGFINDTGEYIIGPGLSAALPFSEGFAAVRTGNKWGYIDTTGNTVIQPMFFEAKSFSEGLAVVSLDGIKRGFIDIQGNIVIEPVYDIALTFSEGVSYVYPYHNGPDPSIRSAYISHDGSLVLQPTLKGYNFGSFTEGLAIVYHQDDILYGYMNKNGEIVIEPLFFIALPFNEGMAAVNYMGVFGYIDNSGSFIIKPDYENTRTIYYGMAPVAYYENECGFLDSNGLLIIDFEFQETQHFSKID